VNLAWQEKKKAVWKRAGGVCEKCKARKGAHVHHLRYAQRRGWEEMEWLQLVCLPCHGEYHPHHTFLTPAQQKARVLEKKADKAAKAKRDAAKCQHCGDTYPKSKHKAICVRFGLHRKLPLDNAQPSPHIPSTP